MKRSKFSLSHYKLLTGNQGELIPIMAKPVLPGDTWQHSTSLLVRTNPLLAPVMHPVRVKVHHWFVPNRLIWTDFEKFITGGPDGEDATSHPTISIGTPAEGSLADYLGVPTVANASGVNALPFRAYTKIWNEFYRDEDLQTELTVNMGNGNDATTNTTLQHISWEKDYFTSARPEAQKGPDVTIPIGTRAPIATDAANGIAVSVKNPTIGSADYRLDSSGATLGASNVAGTEANQLYADLSEATGANIIDVREAFAVMRYEEARSRYGSRYTEYLRYLGVNPSDARLQRPEYLGGGQQTIQFSEVLTSADTEIDTEFTPTGSLKGHGIGAMRSNRYRRFFEEHGWIISLVSVKPKTMYVNGLPRDYRMSTKYDYFQKEFQFVGQQEILNTEVHGAHTQPNGVFGYIDRYDHLRRAESTVSGEFRSTLNFWHMARSLPDNTALNADFVKADPTNRIYSVTSTDQLLIMANHSIQTRRMLAKTGISKIY